MRIIPRTGGVYERLKSEIDLTELVGQFADVEDGVCFCPLNEQSSNNPAFKIYDGDNFYCFSCEAWGDVVSFWRLMHGFPSNWEAAQDLARKYGIDLPQPDPEARARYEERKRKEEGWAERARENHQRLLGPAGGEARAYLADRGFTREHWEQFLLGVNGAGDRVTIPYWTAGQIQGTVDRAIGDMTPKYLYPKAEDFALGRRTLFMQESPKAKVYLLVEGFFDQLAAKVLGIPAIAAGSAGFSTEQTADLLDMAAKGASFVICRDKDGRGIERAQTMLERLYPYARLMPDLPGEGKDLADFYRAGGTADELRGLMDESKDAVELAMAELPSRPRDKVKLLKCTIVPCILQIPDHSERGAVVKFVAAADGLNKDIVQDAITEVEGKLIVQEPERPEEDIPESEWAELLEPGVLGRYVEDVANIRRVVGDKDKEILSLIVCDAVEAQLEPLPTGKPVGGPMMLTGESGRGKNFLADAAVAGLPEEWYLAFTAASATAFYYAAQIDPAFLKHRFLYPNEVEAIDTVVEFLRPMISQAYAEKFVTNKNSDGAFEFQRLRVEGPITGCIPTVRNKLDDQLQTRMLMVEVEDYDGRVREHSRALSEQYTPEFMADPHGHVIPKWQAALRSLTGVRKVVIPFAGKEGFSFDNEEVKHGARLWGNLLGLMCAHAWLEQRNREIRETNGVKAVVATPEDYAVAYNLLKSVGARSIVNISETHLKIVRAAYELKEAENTDDPRRYGSLGFSGRAIAEKARISPGTMSKQRAFLTKSAGLLYEVENTNLLQVAPGVYPDELEAALESGMAGFPSPERVAEWYTPAEAGIGGITESPPQNPHTYGEKVIPDGGIAPESLESPNGTHTAEQGEDPEARVRRLVNEAYDELAENTETPNGHHAGELLDGPATWAADDGLGGEMTINYRPTARDGEPLEWEMDGVKWTYRAESTEDTIDRLALAALRDAGEPLYQTAWRDNVVAKGSTEAQWREAKDRLVAAGRVESAGVMFYERKA